jgi:hypothetical protein
VELGGKKRSISLKKSYSFRKGGLSVDYEIANKEPSLLSLRLCVELNLAAGFSADAVGLAGIRGRDELSLETGKKSGESDLNGLRLENRSKGEKIELRSDLPFALQHQPVYAGKDDFGAKSAIGTERSSYQGCTLSLGWDLELPGDSACRFSITLELRS